MSYCGGTPTISCAPRSEPTTEPDSAGEVGLATKQVLLGIIAAYVRAANALNESCLSEVVRMLDLISRAKLRSGTPDAGE